MPAPVSQNLVTALFYRTLAECFTEARPSNGQPAEIIYVGTFTLADRGIVLEMTSAIIDEMVRNFDGPDRLCVNINHNSAGDTLETARAVGWIQRIYKQEAEDGRISLMADIRWTDDMLQAIAADHYKYLSAEILFHATDTITGEKVGAKLLGCAATNIPAIPDLSPLCLIYTALNSSAKVALTAQTVMAAMGQATRADDDEGMEEGSLMDRVTDVISAFYAAYPDSNEAMWVVRDVAASYCIVSRRSQSDGERTWKVPYTWDDAGDTADFAPMPEWTEVQQVYVPVVAAAKNKSAITLGAMKPTPNCAKAPDDTTWDAGEALAGVKKWSTKADGTVDIAKYHQAFAWNDGSENLTGNKIPHHALIGGQLKVVRAAVIAAGNAMQGSRGGVDIPAADVAGVKRHLAAHYRQFGMTAPWDQQNATKTGNSANLKYQQHTKAVGIPPVAANTEEESMDETQIRALLGLAADADLAIALAALKEKAGKADELTSALEALSVQVKALEDAAKEGNAKETLAMAKDQQILTLTQQKQAFEQETAQLSQRLQTLEGERAERAAKDRIDLALKNRKVRPAELKDKDGFLEKLAKEQPETFDNIMAIRPAYAVDLTIERGAGGESPDTGETPADKLFRLTDEALAKDENLNPQQARALVLSQNPDLRSAIPTTKTGTR